MDEGAEGKNANEVVEFHALCPPSVLFAGHSGPGMGRRRKITKLPSLMDSILYSEESRPRKGREWVEKTK